MVKRLALIVAMLFIPALAKSDSVWTYQGNSPEPNGPGEGFTLTGTVLLNNNDQAIAWNFVAGPDVFTNFNSTGSINPFACLNCTQPFAYWDIALNIPTGGPFNMGTHLISFSDGVGFVSPYYSGSSAFDIAWNNDGTFGQVVVSDNPGTWTEVVATPEPGALALLGVGLTALALAIAMQKFRA
jgi:hypothetical protein